MRTIIERTGEPAYTVTWAAAEQVARQAGYSSLPMGWTMANGEPCLLKTNSTQRHPPLKVTDTFKAWIITHASCSGLELPANFPRTV